MAAMPPALRPAGTAQLFPRIANQLAALWKRPEEFAPYLSDLLIDKRGGRTGFPVAILRELEAMKWHYATLHPDCFKGRPRSKAPS